MSHHYHEDQGSDCAPDLRPCPNPKCRRLVEMSRVDWAAYCPNRDCLMRGPIYDPTGEKWNTMCDGLAATELRSQDVAQSVTAAVAAPGAELRCCKCGSTTIETEWHLTAPSDLFSACRPRFTFHFTGIESKDEHLHHSCGACNYEWMASTLDTEPMPAAPHAPPVRVVVLQKRIPSLGSEWISMLVFGTNEEARAEIEKVHAGPPADYRIRRIPARDSLARALIFYGLPSDVTCESEVETAAAPEQHPAEEGTSPAAAPSTASLPPRLLMQPVILDPHGVPRFRENLLVRALLDHGNRTGFGFNELHAKFSRDRYQEEHQQFAQLIGYSISAFGGLEEASPEHVQEADRRAGELLDAFDKSSDPISDGEGDRRPPSLRERT